MVPDRDVPEEEAECVPAVEGQVDALHAQLVPGVPVGGEPEPLEVGGRPQLVVEDPRPKGVRLAVVLHLRRVVYVEIGVFSGHSSDRSASPKIVTGCKILTMI